jgi:hypothetical protein
VCVCTCKLIFIPQKTKLDLSKKINILMNYFIIEYLGL